jgi:hypothetical protein
MEYRLPSNDQMNANATHYGILGGMIAKTTGPIVEFGLGHYSTPLIHYLCQNRKAVSVETNREWTKYFEARFGNESHEFYCTENRLISTAFFSNSKYNEVMWGVAFIDNGPDADRVKIIRNVRQKAKYIVVHDSEPGAVSYGWGDVFDTFKYKLYDDFWGNGTTVVSDVEEIGLK